MAPTSMADWYVGEGGGRSRGDGYHGVFLSVYVYVYVCGGGGGASACV